MQTTLFLNTLPRATQKTFNLLAGVDWLNADRTGWYLAGGTALALQLGHRKSFDLDFFTQKENFDAQALRECLVKSGFVIDSFAGKTIFANYNGAKSSFISYPYFIPKHEKISIGKISMLHSDDIAVMKIIAISQRGRKRDFVDLSWYLKQTKVPLEELIKRLWTQYPGTAHEINHIMKALTYFTDAEDDPMPKMLVGLTWKEVKFFIENEASQLIKRDLIDGCL